MDNLGEPITLEDLESASEAGKKAERRRIIKELSKMHKETWDVWIDIQNDDSAEAYYSTRLEMLAIAINIVKRGN